MEQKIKNQRGYLLLTSIIILGIISIVAALTLNMFSSSIKSTEYSSDSKSSFYLANSSLEIAKREIVGFKKKCSDINGKSLYTNRTLPNMRGEYTVSCSTNIASSTLNAEIVSTNSPIILQNIVTGSSALANSLSANDTSKITLSDLTAAKQFSINNSMAKIDNEYILYDKRVGAELVGLTRGVAGSSASAHSIGATVSQGLLDSGIIIIGGEAIEYKGISGNTLQNVKRAILGTPEDTHNNNAIVSQNQCILVSKVGAPNLSSPTGKSKISEIISPDILTESLSFGGNEPGLVSIGSVDLKGDANIKNLHVNSSDSNFPGSTILTRGTIDFKGTSYTEVGNGVSSQIGDIKADVVQNTALFDSTNLYDYIFSVGLGDLKNEAINAVNLNDALNNSGYLNKVVLSVGETIDTDNVTITTTVQPKTLIINGNLGLTGDNVKVTVGSPDMPILMVIDGDLSITGTGNNFTIHGILYVTGDLKATGTGSGGGGMYDNILNVIGFAGVEGITKLFSDATIEMNPDYIKQLKTINNYLISPDYIKPYKLKELFE